MGQIEIVRMYCFGVHGKSRVLPLAVICEATSVCVCSFVCLLDCSADVAVFFVAEFALPQVQNVSRLTVQVILFSYGDVVDGNLVGCVDERTLLAILCVTSLVFQVCLYVTQLFVFHHGVTN